MTLEEYILTYKGITSSGEEGFVCNIADYYDKVVMPLDNKFRERSLNSSKLVICPLHDDHDPSLGLMKRRFPDGSYSFHCFGCGKSGTVIRLHQFVSMMYNNKELTVHEACTELCNLFGIPIPNLEDIAEDDYEKLFYKKFNELDRLEVKYTSKDFASDILAIRKKGVDLDLVNSACVKLIATKKELYS